MNPKNIVTILEKKIEFAQKARIRQYVRINKGVIKYLYKNKSCCTHVGDVGRGGGIPLPFDLRMKDIAKELRKQGFTVPK